MCRGRCPSLLSTTTSFDTQIERITNIPLDVNKLFESVLGAFASIITDMHLFEPLLDVMAIAIT